MYFIPTLTLTSACYCMFYGCMVVLWRKVLCHCLFILALMWYLSSSETYGLC